MYRGKEKSERSERRDKNFKAETPAPLLPLAHSFSNRPGDECSLVDFTPESDHFTLLGSMYGFLVWLSGNGIQYLEPSIVSNTDENGQSVKEYRVIRAEVR